MQTWMTRWRRTPRRAFTISRERSLRRAGTPGAMMSSRSRPKQSSTRSATSGTALAPLATAACGLQRRLAVNVIMETHTQLGFFSYFSYTGCTHRPASSDICHRCTGPTSSSSTRSPEQHTSGGASLLSRMRRIRCATLLHLCIKVQDAKQKHILARRGAGLCRANRRCIPLQLSGLLLVRRRPSARLAAMSC